MVHEMMSKGFVAVGGMESGSGGFGWYPGWDSVKESSFFPHHHNYSKPDLWSIVDNPDWTRQVHDTQRSERRDQR